MHFNRQLLHEKQLAAFMILQRHYINYSACGCPLQHTR